MKTGLRRRAEVITLLVLLSLASVAGGAASYDLWGFTPVLLLNGTGVDVVVRIDGKATAVPSGQRIKARSSVGLARVEVFSRGELVSTEWVYFPARQGAVIYDILGAQTFCLEEVGSGAGGSSQPGPCFSGVTAFSAPDVGDGPRGHALVELGTDWHTTLERLRLGPDPTPAERLESGLLPLVGLLPELPGCVDAAMATRYGPGGGLTSARGRLQHFPENKSALMAYSTAARRAGLADELNEALRDRSAREPGSTLLVEARSRNEQPAVTEALLEPLRAKDPKNAELEAMLAVAALQQGHAAEALRHFDAAVAVDPKSDDVPWHVRALAAAGRPEEAARLLAKAILETGSAEALVAYGSLVKESHLTAMPSVESLARTKGMRPETLRWLDSLLPGVVPPGEESVAGAMANAVAIQRAALRSPSDAWEASRTIDVAAARLAGLIRLVLALEFERVGDSGLATRYAAGLFELDIPVSKMNEYVRSGREFPEMVFMRPDEKAVLQFVRARALEAAGQPAEELYALAEQEDAMRSVMTAVRRQWRHPAGGRR